MSRISEPEAAISKEQAWRTLMLAKTTLPEIEVAISRMHHWAAMDRNDAKENWASMIPTLDALAACDNPEQVLVELLDEIDKLHAQQPNGESA